MRKVKVEKRDAKANLKELKKTFVQLLVFLKRRLCMKITKLTKYLLFDLISVRMKMHCIEKIL